MVVERLQHENCSLGDKIFLLGVIEEVIKKLGQPILKTHDEEEKNNY